MNLKSFLCLCGFLAVLMIGANSLYAQRSSQREVENATWQTSVDDSKRGTILLGIRDKWGSLGGFNASFVVTAPNKKKFRASTRSTDDEWAYINFPGEFSGNATLRGTYTVVFYVNGIVIGRDKFRFRP